MRVRVLGLAVSIAAVLLAAGNTVAFADLQLASVGCSDGSQFQVAADTNTLTKLTNTITAINTQPLGLTCGLNLLSSSSSTSSTTKAYAVGGGSTAGFHFSFSAHFDPDTLQPKGHAVVSSLLVTSSGFQAEGPINCLQVAPPAQQVLIAHVGFLVTKSSGTGAPALGSTYFFDVQDVGAPGTQIPPDQFDTPPTPPNLPCDPTMQGNSSVITFTSNIASNLLTGNIVVRSS